MVQVRQRARVQKSSESCLYLSLDVVLVAWGNCMKWRAAQAVALLCVLLVSGCKRSEPKPAEPQSESESAQPSGAALAALGVQTGSIMNKSFFLSSYEHFPFELPAHAKNPKLRGSFQAVIGSKDPYDTSVNVDLLLMTEAEFKDYAQSRVDTAVTSWVNRRQETVDYELSLPEDEPVKYELVFRGTTSTSKIRMVQASFSVFYEK